MRQKIIDYIKKKYKSSPEYLWKKYPDYAVFRHEDNNKWFALQAPVPKDKLGLEGNEIVEVINVKVDDMFFRDMLIRQDGILPAYHMNKQHWVTVILDGTVSEEQVCSLIDSSYMATASAKKKEKIRPPKEWIIPANPKYYDIEHKVILYNGHSKPGGKIPVSNGLSKQISKDLKKRGFKYVGEVTIYSHLQACGIINDHDETCPCYEKINKMHSTVNRRRDKEVY